jgi:hypothetical protein
MFHNSELPSINIRSQPPIGSDSDDQVTDNDKKEEHLFAEMIGKRNQELAGILFNSSPPNRLEVSCEFLPFLLEQSLRLSTSSPIYLRASFHSLLQLHEEPSSRMDDKRHVEFP